MKPPSKKGSKRPQRKHSEGSGSGSGRTASGAKTDSGKISASGKRKPAKPSSGRGKSTGSVSRKGRPTERTSEAGKPAEHDSGKRRSDKHNSGAGRPAERDSGKRRSDERTSGAGKPAERDSGKRRSDERNSGAGRPAEHDSGKRRSDKHNSGAGRPGERVPGKRRSDERNSRKGRPAERAYGEPIRLNRFIANSGVCSRREADDLIRSGVIKVNGKTITELGTRVGPSDSVSYDGKILKGEPKVYVLLNKPKDCVTTVKDTHGRKTVLDLVHGCCSERIYPVGRLDRNTTGVLLLTNDGEMAEALSHPSFNKKKIYHIHLNMDLEEKDMQKLSEGFELEDGFIKPDRIEYVDPNDRRQIGMEVHSGRNRIVRRMFEHLDYKVLRLDRVFYAGLIKKGLSRGHWRHLNLKEVNMLKMSVPGIKSGKRPRKY